jgi:monoterpene epsilon-lactone hydrolase
MKGNGAPFAVIGLAVGLCVVPAAVDRAWSEAAPPSTSPSVVTFSPDSPVPPDISPQAKAFFLSQRPAPGSAPVFLPDCTDPAQREAFLQYRRNLSQIWNGRAQASPIPWWKVDATLDGVGVTWLTTPRTTRRGALILYLHGGAYSFGSAHGNVTTMIPIADRTGIRVLAIDYRLAPETPFPGGLDDCKKVYRGLLRRGYLARNIIVEGDSAGGGLALALALSLRNEGTPLPAALVLLEPWADLTHTGDTAHTLAPHSSLNWEEHLAGGAKAYCAGRDPRSPLISPVFADYTGLPPMLIQHGTRDILLSDSIRVNHQALRARVPATLDVWEGMFHGYQAAGLPESSEALADVEAYILKHLR